MNFLGSRKRSRYVYEHYNWRDQVDSKGLPYLYECDTWYESDSDSPSETEEPESTNGDEDNGETSDTTATYEGYTMSIHENLRNHVTLVGDEHDNVNEFHIGTFMDKSTCPDNTTLLKLEATDDGIAVTFEFNGINDRTMCITLSRKRLRKLMRKNLKKFIPQ